jgi:hypothetical protein
MFMHEVITHVNRIHTANARGNSPVPPVRLPPQVALFNLSLGRLAKQIAFELGAPIRIDETAPNGDINHWWATPSGQLRRTVTPAPQAAVPVLTGGDVETTDAAGRTGRRTTATTTNNPTTTTNPITATTATTTKPATVTTATNATSSGSTSGYGSNGRAALTAPPLGLPSGPLLAAPPLVTGSTFTVQPTIQQSTTTPDEERPLPYGAKGKAPAVLAPTLSAPSTATNLTSLTSSTLLPPPVPTPDTSRLADLIVEQLVDNGVPDRDTPAPRGPIAADDLENSAVLAGIAGRQIAEALMDTSRPADDPVDLVAVWTLLVGHENPAAVFMAAIRHLNSSVELHDRLIAALAAGRLHGDLQGLGPDLSALLRAIVSD